MHNRKKNMTRSFKLYEVNCKLADLTRLNLNTSTLKLFIEIQKQSLKPDHYSLSTTLKACANTTTTRTTLTFTSQLHAHALRTNLIAFSHVSNSLLSAYAKANKLNSLKRVFQYANFRDAYSWTTVLSACIKAGDVRYAFHIFDEMPRRNVAGWNAVITGFAGIGEPGRAVSVFRDMMREVGVRCDGYGFASVLSLCDGEEFEFGRQVHSVVVKSGVLARSSVVNALVRMFFGVGNVRDAWLVFEEAEDVRDEVTFNVMIDGLGSVGRDGDAVRLFKEMLRAGLRPTELSFVSVMSLSLGYEVGWEVHCLAIKMGFEGCTSASNAAIAMYSGFGDLDAAYEIFRRLEVKDIVSWNTMISCYAQASCGRDALLTCLEMQRVGIKADEFTYGSLITSSESLEVVEMMQSCVIKNGVISKIEVSNALVCTYAKYGIVERAYEIFSVMSAKSLVSWNTIMFGFLVNGLPMQSLGLFSELLTSNFKPNAYTLSIALSICASTSLFRHGKEIHCFIFRNGLSRETLLGNALITMYARCGLLDWSLRVFNGMIERDTVSWNALISAYAQHGKGEEAVYCFDRLLQMGVVEPDQATFTAVLSACSHAGLVDAGTQIFNSMLNYGFSPGEDHFSCMVDLLGRAGYLDEAEKVINSQHIAAKSYIWWTLFGACAAHGNLRLGRVVAGFLIESERHDPSVYVLLSNIYAASGQWEEATRIRELSKRTGVMKQPGYSWIGS